MPPLRSRPTDPAVSVAVGITVGLLASLVQSLGLTIQRKSHILNHDQPEEARKPDYRRPLWLLGFAIFITSNILGSVFQIASLPVVLLAPLGAVSLLWNAFFARLILGDVFSPYMVFGTFLVAGGAVLIGIFGIVPEPAHSLNDLLILFQRPAFVVYFSLLGVTVVLILAVTHIAEWNVVPKQAIELPPSPILGRISITSHNHPQTIPEDTPLLLNNKPSPPSSIFSDHSRMPTLLAVSYASMSGLLSGMCLIFAKSGVELLLLTAAGDNQFGHWQSWMLVLGLVVFALLQLWYLHKSLVLGDPVLVCPLAFCFYNLSTILNGLVYFDQFDRLSSPHLGLVILGITLLLVGVWAVSAPQNTQDEDDPIKVGGVAEGDLWNAAEVRSVASSLMSPSQVNGHQRASTTPASHARDDDEEYPDHAGWRQAPRLAHDLRHSSRRTVSSPSTFLDGGEPSPWITDEPMPGDPDESSAILTAQSVDALDAIVTPARRIRTLSNGSHIHSPLQGSISYGAIHFPSFNLPRSAFPRTRRGTIAVDGGSREGNVGTGFTGGYADRPLPPLPGFSIGLSPLSPGFALVPRHQRESETSAPDPEREEQESGATADERQARPGTWSTLRQLMGVESLLRRVRRRGQ